MKFKHMSEGQKMMGFCPIYDLRTRNKSFTKIILHSKQFDWPCNQDLVCIHIKKKK